MTGHPRIALVLGGGGARGLAHVPVMEALDDLGLRPSLIIGTSIGAVLGWPYAAGLAGKDVRAHALELLSRPLAIAARLGGRPLARLAGLSKLAAWGTALLNSEQLLEVVAPAGIARSFENLVIPFEVVATDFHDQTQAVLSQGPVLPAVSASMAIPGVFSPVMIGGRAHVDGGLVNPLPFDLVDARADLTIAVAVNGAPLRPDASHVPSAIETLSTSFQIIERSLMRAKLAVRRPDILIEAPIDRFRALDFHRAADILAAAEPVRETVKRALAARLEGGSEGRSLSTPRGQHL